MMLASISTGFCLTWDVKPNIQKIALPSFRMLSLGMKRGIINILWFYILLLSISQLFLSGNITIHELYSCKDFQIWTVSSHKVTSKLDAEVKREFWIFYLSWLKSQHLRLSPFSWCLPRLLYCLEPGFLFLLSLLLACCFPSLLLFHTYVGNFYSSGKLLDFLWLS